MPMPTWKPTSRAELDTRIRKAIEGQLSERIEKAVRTAVRIAVGASVGRATTNIWDAVSEQNDRIDQLGEIMSKVSDALAQLDDATNQVAARLDALAAQLASSDGDTAAAIQTEADRLRGMAADPNNPVPPVDTPVDTPPVDPGTGF